MLSGRPVDDAEAAEEAGLRLLRRHGLAAVVVTLGGIGSVLVRREGALRYPPWPVPVIDTIGAGDAFARTLAASLAGGFGIEKAALHGNAAGALTVTRAGAYDALPEAEAVRRLVGSRRA